MGDNLIVVSERGVALTTRPLLAPVEELLSAEELARAGFAVLPLSDVVSAAGGGFDLKQRVEHSLVFLPKVGRRSTSVQDLTRDRALLLKRDRLWESDIFLSITNALGRVRRQRDQQALDRLREGIGKEPFK